jgi:hypothetical protein
MGKSNLDKERQKAKAEKGAEEKNGSVALTNDTAEQAVGNGESGDVESKHPAKMGAKKALRRALKAEMNKKNQKLPRRW